MTSALGDAISRAIPWGFARSEGAQVGFCVSEVMAAFVARLAGNLGVGRLWVRAIFRRPVGFAENVVPQGAGDDPDSSFDSL
jgi:hypothetical protein